MARGLLDHEIFDLLGDRNVSELDFSDEETKEQFEHKELQQLLDDFEEWEDEDEVNEPTIQIRSNINFNVSEKKNIKWKRAPFCPPL